MGAGTAPPWYVWAMGEENEQQGPSCFQRLPGASPGPWFAPVRIGNAASATSKAGSEGLRGWSGGNQACVPAWLPLSPTQLANLTLPSLGHVPSTFLIPSGRHHTPGTRDLLHRDHQLPGYVPWGFSAVGLNASPFQTQGTPCGQGLPSIRLSTRGLSSPDVRPCCCQGRFYRQGHHPLFLATDELLVLEQKLQKGNWWKLPVNI